MQKQVFSGDVVERKSSEPKQFILKPNSGFPKSSHTRNQHIKTDTPSTSTFINNDVEQKKQFLAISKTCENDFEQNNIQQIMSMSKTELDEAMQEIMTTFSPKSLEILNRRSTIDSLKQNTAILSDNISTEKIDTTDYQNSVIDIASISSEHELQNAISNAPPQVQLNVEWIKPLGNKIVVTKTEIEKNHSSNTTNKGNKEIKNNIENKSTATGFRLTSDRFDLSGSKVIEHSVLYSQMKELFTTTDPLSSLSSNDIHNLCEEILHLFNTLGFFRYPPSDIDSQPQHELYNHQYDQHLPGYSFQEISEVSTIIIIIYDIVFFFTYCII